MQASFSVRLRGIEVDVDGKITPAEPDVGIMSEGIEEYELRDSSTGALLDWELTDEEVAEIQSAAAQWAADYE